MATESTETHEVTFEKGGRPGDEFYTASCSCGKQFKGTHNYRLRIAITRHLNIVKAQQAKKD